MIRRRLPIGIQTFRKMREEGCYYVDKTAYVERLLAKGAHYFLSRPRRFGKSLFLDTLKEFFEGNQALFAGLYIHDRHDWSERHPVVRLDFARGHFEDAGSLHANLSAQLDGIERSAGVSPRYDTAPERFGYLIQSLHERTGRRVVVLAARRVRQADPGRAGGGVSEPDPVASRQPPLSARTVRDHGHDDQGSRCARTVHVPDRREQVHQES